MREAHRVSPQRLCGATLEGGGANLTLQVLKGNITILHTSLWQNWELPKTIEPQRGVTTVLPHSENFQIAFKVLFSSFIQSTEWGMKYMMFNESKVLIFVRIVYQCFSKYIWFSKLIHYDAAHNKIMTSPSQDVTKWHCLFSEHYKHAKWSTIYILKITWQATGNSRNFI